MLHLRDAKLGAADLANANLSNTNLGDAILIGGRIGRSYITNAYIAGGHVGPTGEYIGPLIAGADLTNADLTNARWAEEYPAPTGWVRDADSGRLSRANALTDHSDN